MNQLSQQVEIVQFTLVKVRSVINNVSFSRQIIKGFHLASHKMAVGCGIYTREKLPRKC